MKKSYLFLAAIASVALVSCSNEEFVGEDIQPTTSNAINFGTSFQAVTRADKYGAAAAEKLGNKFVVYGTKHAATEDKTATNDAVVFNNFQVEWTSGTANTTESNTANWEYVGKKAYASGVATQGIKYWDFSTVGYTFYAFSSPDITFPANAADKVSVTKVTSDENSLYNKGYELTVKNGAKLDQLYFSNRVEVAKANYEKTVSFTFQNTGTKVRFGFYETIPGYTVKIDRFYTDADGPTSPINKFSKMNDAKTDGFYAALQNVKRSDDQTLNVTYYGDGDFINQPKLTNPTGGYDYSLKLGNGTGIIGKELKTTSSDPTWVAGYAAANYYTFVYPFEDNTNPLLLKLDFTMTAEDGTGEVIHVRGARAVVPAEYVQWKSNYAYTYIFKISDKSNGTTGAVDANGDPTDTEGLKPITFDAIVVDIEGQTQETITSVATNSITVTSEGAINDDFSKDKPIYVTVSNNTSATHKVTTPTGIGDAATQAQVYKLNKAASEAEVFAYLTGTLKGLTLEPVSGAIVDGNKVKFTPTEAGDYVYVYTTTKYAAPQYLVQTAGTYDSSKTYYMKNDEGVYYAVTVPSAAAFNEHKEKLYLVDPDNPGTPGVYDITVIKVQ